MAFYQRGLRMYIKKILNDYLDCIENPFAQN